MIFNFNKKLKFEEKNQIFPANENNNKVIRIGITGPQGSGKTTIMNVLKELKKNKKEPILEKFEILPEYFREYMAKMGFGINESGSLETQILAVNKRIEYFLENRNKNFIMCRCFLDEYVYTKYMQQKYPKLIQPWFLNYAYNILKIYINKFTKIFYIPYEFERMGKIKEDGVRSTNEQFLLDICNLFEDTITKLQKEKVIYFNKVNEEVNKIITVTGSIEDRVKKIINILQIL